MQGQDFGLLMLVSRRQQISQQTLGFFKFFRGEQNHLGRIRLLEIKNSDANPFSLSEFLQGSQPFEPFPKIAPETTRQRA